MFQPSRGHLQNDIWNITLYNKRPYEIMLDKTIKETYLIDTVISTSHDLYRNSRNVQIYKKLKQEYGNWTWPIE
jgi:hypothetical protein